LATAINAVKSSAITIAVQNVSGISKTKTCILRYATIFDGLKFPHKKAVGNRTFSEVFYNKIIE